MNTNDFELSSVIYKINDSFKLPITYIDEKHELKKNIADDLELINTVDSSSNPIYSYGFNNDNDVSQIVTSQIVQYYTKK